MRARTIFLLVLMLALAGLVGLFLPASNNDISPARSSSKSQPPVASAPPSPSAIPASPSRIEMPRNPGLPAGEASPPAPSSRPESPHSIASGLGERERGAPAAVQSDHAVEIDYDEDGTMFYKFGKMELSEGVPTEVTLPDGNVSTLTLKTIPATSPPQLELGFNIKQINGNTVTISELKAAIPDGTAVQMKVDSRAISIQPVLRN